MTDWARVRWSEARQVLALLDRPATDDPDPQLRPAAYFERLVQDGKLQDAAAFLGQALPRLEAVAWAARSVNELPNEKRPPQESAALKAALLWVQDPTEARRRTAYDAAEACDPASPERLAGLAAFFSGGSITPADCPPLPAPKDAAGRFAAGAVLSAAARQSDHHGALRRCLERGAALARSGLG